ncbi:MAG: carbon monoxide dehydrogenase subunit G [Hyphomicrobiaceae bacterium]|nr:MAG: carbon monoxide dehydrogenase subunit G [Hyphomicrobiaceae bacterium]
MDMTGETMLGASREKVWAALNDPAVLKDAIPGCEALDKVSDTQFTATVVTKVGPIKARFSGKVLLTDIVAPVSYTISGEGQGGIAGFARGGADVSLHAVDSDNTVLRYVVKAQVGGKIAQLGARLIDATARKLAGQFFERFSEIVSGHAPAAGASHEVVE